MTIDGGYLEESLSTLSGPTTPPPLPPPSPRFPERALENRRAELKANTRAHPAGTPWASRAWCVAAARPRFKANSGTQLPSEGRLRMRPCSGRRRPSHSQRRDASAFHKCIKVSSGRHKDARKQKKKGLRLGRRGGRGEGGVLLTLKQREQESKRHIEPSSKPVPRGIKFHLIVISSYSYGSKLKVKPHALFSTF